MVVRWGIYKLFTSFQVDFHLLLWGLSRDDLTTVPSLQVAAAAAAAAAPRSPQRSFFHAAPHAAPSPSHARTCGAVASVISCRRFVH